MNVKILLYEANMEHLGNGPFIVNFKYCVRSLEPGVCTEVYIVHHVMKVQSSQTLDIRRRIETVHYWLLLYGISSGVVYQFFFFFSFNVVTFCRLTTGGHIIVKSCFQRSKFHCLS